MRQYHCVFYCLWACQVILAIHVGFSARCLSISNRRRRGYHYQEEPLTYYLTSYVEPRKVDTEKVLSKKLKMYTVCNGKYKTLKW